MTEDRERSGTVMNTLSSSDDVNNAFLQSYLVFNNVLKALFIYRSRKVFFMIFLVMFLNLI